MFYFHRTAIIMIFLLMSFYKVKNTKIIGAYIIFPHYVLDCPNKLKIVNFKLSHFYAELYDQKITLCTNFVTFFSSGELSHYPSATI